MWSSLAPAVLMSKNKSRNIPLDSRFSGQLSGLSVGDSKGPYALLLDSGMYCAMIEPWLSKQCVAILTPNHLSLSFVPFYHIFYHGGRVDITRWIRVQDTFYVVDRIPEHWDCLYD
ncbi:hypothetical protein AAHA92_00215 [Salvia divinorum]|uniref:Uncharacterized protein n=1 Tax=Salvia divinorum TaxID=28513 RepID=A0ABD1IJW9_SALDI